MLWPEAAALYIFSQMTFTTPEHLKHHLVETITSAFIAEVQSTCKHKNNQVDHHKENNIKYPRVYTGRYINHAEKRLAERSEVFGWDEPRFYPHYLNIVKDAQAQADAAINLLEQRVGQHMTDQEYIYKTDLNINYSNNLIEGRVYGHVYDYIADERTIEERREATKFEIYVRMIWNYRYGENSANGHLTQYTQFRSERHGAEMIGKSKVQKATDEEKAAKAAEKKAAADAKQAAKWERFAKLPVQLEKWLTKEIHAEAARITEEGVAKAKAECDAIKASFDQEWYIKVRAERIEKNNAMRNDCRAWQNDDTGLKALFNRGIDTRNKLKEMYGVW
tara:strand:+ start:1171 stop:2175 length:1005 start_codon:yes stop_codon:yes gene_type:complete